MAEPEKDKDQQENPPTKPADTARTGEPTLLTGADLRVTIDPMLLKSDGVVIDQGKAEQIIAKRISGVLGDEWVSLAEASGQDTGLDRWMSGRSTLDRDMAEVIVDAIGPDKITETLATNIDLRPFIAKMSEAAQASDGGILLRSRTEGNLMELRPMGGESVSAVNTPLLDRLMVRLQEDAVSQLTSATQGRLSPADAQKFDPTVAGPSPHVLAAQQMAGNDIVGPGGGLAGAENAANGDPVMLSADEVREMFLMEATTDISPLVSFEIQNEGGAEPYTMPEAELAGAVRGRNAVPDWAPGKTAPQVSARRAVNMLTSGEFTPREVENLQRRLIKAGYFDGLPEPVFGDISDAATQQAWMLALGDRVRSNTPLNTLIESRTKARMSKVIDSDGMITLNQLAQQTIGRRLDRTEMAQLVAAMNQLKGQQQGKNGQPGGTELIPGAWFSGEQAQQELLTTHDVDVRRTEQGNATQNVVGMLERWASDVDGG